MENDTFQWEIYDILTENIFDDKSINLKDNKELNSYENNSITKINSSTKYNFDLGSIVIAAEDKIFSINKNNNNINNNLSNSYFKIDQIFFNSKNSKNLTAKNIYSLSNGPRYRITNVYNQI